MRFSVGQRVRLSEKGKSLLLLPKGVKVTQKYGTVVEITDTGRVCVDWTRSKNKTLRPKNYHPDFLEPVATSLTRDHQE